MATVESRHDRPLAKLLSKYFSEENPEALIDVIDEILILLLSKREHITQQFGGDE